MGANVGWYGGAGAGLLLHEHAMSANATGGTHGAKCRIESLLRGI
jgi:hypothetical protein